MNIPNEMQSVGGNSNWSSLYKVGGIAALVAGVGFRRNMAAEILLFGGQTKPGTVADWFSLLQNNGILGLSLLNVFDLVNCALLSVMFLALYASLRQTSQSYVTIGTTCGLVGVATYFASNASLSMLSLSNDYAAATTEAQKTLFLAAGQTLLTVGQGTGAYMSLLLLAVAGLIFSVVMLRTKTFSNATAYVGILASVFDLIYCVTFAFIPELDALLLSAAGLCLMVWHILVGRKLYKLSNISKIVGYKND